MRISTEGVWSNVDTVREGLFLPWNAIVGFRVKRRVGEQLLFIDLADNVTPQTPGVIGLDHPDVQRALRTRVLFGIKGLRVNVRSIGQPLGEVNHALSYFGNGKVQI